jgi:hypothetical protein
MPVAKPWTTSTHERHASRQTFNQKKVRVHASDPPPTCCAAPLLAGPVSHYTVLPRISREIQVPAIVLADVKFVCVYEAAF